MSTYNSIFYKTLNIFPKLLLPVYLKFINYDIGYCAYLYFDEINILGFRKGKQQFRMAKGIKVNAFLIKVQNFIVISRDMIKLQTKKLQIFYTCKMLRIWRIQSANYFRPNCKKLAILTETSQGSFFVVWNVVVWAKKILISLFL